MHHPKRRNFIVRLILFPFYLIRRLARGFWYFILPKKRPFLASHVKEKARGKFGKLLDRFKREKKREPTRNERIRLAINASHMTIKRRGKRGHWKRQKVRKVLLEEQGILFKMK